MRKFREIKESRERVLPSDQTSRMKEVIQRVNSLEVELSNLYVEVKTSFEVSELDIKLVQDKIAHYKKLLELDYISEEDMEAYSFI